VSVTAVAAVALIAGTTATAVGAGTTANWPAYEDSPLHHSISVDPTITAVNAAGLHAAWHFTAAAPTMSGQPKAGFDASPTVVNGRVYLVSRTGMFYALNATTGAVVWQKQLDYGPGGACAAKGPLATPTVVPDPVTNVLTVYAGGAHYLYALNAATGGQKWKTAIGPATAAGEGRYLNLSSPTVSGGRIFMGLAGKCEADPIRGGVVSLNQHTGAVQHTYFTVPADKVGASVWSSAAVTGSNAFITTGNPDPTGTTIDDAYSIVRLNTATLAKVDKYTVPTLSQTADSDFGSSPTLFTTSVGGVSTAMVAACNKDGNLRAWRRGDLAAGPVWTDQIGVSNVHQVGGNCLTSPAWDAAGGRLLMAANQTTVGATTVPGALRAIDPATGAYLWEQPLPCAAVGSLTDNGQVIAVPMLTCPTGVSPSIQLFRASDGTPLGSVAASGKVFSQPVFAAGELLVADEAGTLTAYRP
jgi:polyvinyl alcohol dehydrogenase (cytochrome)